MHFGEYELSPGLIGLSPLPTSHPNTFQRILVRSSIVLTRGGASRFDGETFTQFMPKDGLFTDMVRTIFTDKSGNVWFGYKATDEGGLTKYDGKSFTNFNTKDGLCNSSIMVMYEANNGSLWLGGDMNNLCIYDGKNFKEFKSIDGKPFEEIITIIEDKKGAIWFGGRYGLWKFDGETVTNLIM